MILEIGQSAEVEVERVGDDNTEHWGQSEDGCWCLQVPEDLG
jgi:hypothetical protein